MLNTKLEWSILFGFCVLYYIYMLKQKRKEPFFIDPKVANQFHLPANYRRPTFTLLTSVGRPAPDIMDTLPLPEDIKNQFTEWIDKGLLLKAKDQMSCGGCWAFASADALADKYIIGTAGKWMPPFGLSVQEMISCAQKMGMQFAQGCSGGIPQFALDAVAKDGIKMEKFDPGPNSAYTYYQVGKDPATSCEVFRSTTCPCDKIEEQLEKFPINTDKMKFNIDPQSRYKTADGAHIYTSHGDNDDITNVELWPDIPQSVIQKNIERMKKAIYFEGSITAGIRMTQDFYNFKPTTDNYYQYDGTSPQTGGHAICIVGWKMVDTTPVWICRNSWGENWGYGFEKPEWDDPVSGTKEQKYKGGFWNHIMGVNDSFIESNAAGAHPDLSIPEIQKYLNKAVEKTWYKSTTLRDIYIQNIEEGDQGNSMIEVIKQIQISIPYDQIPSDAYTEILKQKYTKATILTKSKEDSSLLLQLIDSMTVVNYESVKALALRLYRDIDEEIVLSLVGDLGVYYALVGIPSRWNYLDLDNYIQQSTHPGIIADRVYVEMTNFITNSKLIDSKVLVLTGVNKNKPVNFGPYVYELKCDTNDMCDASLKI